MWTFTKQRNLTKSQDILASAASIFVCLSFCKTAEPLQASKPCGIACWSTHLIVAWCYFSRMSKWMAGWSQCLCLQHHIYPLNTKLHCPSLQSKPSMVAWITLQYIPVHRLKDKFTFFKVYFKTRHDMPFCILKELLVAVIVLPVYTGCKEIHS